jgi:DNA-binding transcriptional MerR regulator
MGPQKAKVLAEYLSEAEEAAELRVAVRTLRAWRQRGEGPPFTKVGKRILYSFEGTVKWLELNEQHLGRALGISS